MHTQTPLAKSKPIKVLAVQGLQIRQCQPITPMTQAQFNNSNNWIE